MRTLIILKEYEPYFGPQMPEGTRQFSILRPAAVLTKAEMDMDGIPGGDLYVQQTAIHVTWTGQFYCKTTGIKPYFDVFEEL